MCSKKAAWHCQPFCGEDVKASGESRQKEQNVVSCQEDLLQVPCVQVQQESCYCYNEPYVSNVVIEDCLQGSYICICSAVSSSNEQKRYNTDSFSASKQLEYIVCGNQNYYGDKKYKEVFKKLVDVGSECVYHIENSMMYHVMKSATGMKIIEKQSNLKLRSYSFGEYK